jgi:hypothetical protein
MPIRHTHVRDKPVIKNTKMNRILEDLPDIKLHASYGDVRPSPKLG